MDGAADGDALREWLRRRFVSAGQALALGVLSYAVGVPLLVLSILSVAFIPLFGTGIFLVPAITVAVRALTGQRRHLAEHWSAVPVPVPYRSRPTFAPRGLVGCWQRCRWILGDPATWRDLLWLLSAPLNLLLGVLPAWLVMNGVEGVVVTPLVPAGSTVYSFGFGWLVDLPRASWLSVPLGVVLVALGLAIAPWAVRLHGRFAHSLLAPTRSAELALRVSRLTETRAAAVDAEAAELRRIERDLHDGAQARLVALGMNLGMAEDLVATDPQAAVQLLAEARESSDKALAELRGLVRGIHPPVLAERGLDGAVRALALDLPLPVDVDVVLAGRPPAPVESAAYFAVAETLANVVKHSRTGRAWLWIRHADGRLSMTVTDDGVGGADPAAGTGLRGIERRLATFDGTVHVASPIGGPTVVSLELPCALSSPRTSPS